MEKFFHCSYHLEIGVLMKTQVDGGVNSRGGVRASVGFLREHRGQVLKFEVCEDFSSGTDIGLFSEFSRKLDAAVSHFVKEWDGCVCVKENEYWACLVKDYFLFRGYNIQFTAGLYGKNGCFWT